MRVGPSYLPVAISSLASSRAFAPAALQVLMGWPSTPMAPPALDGAGFPLALIGEVSTSPLRAASRLRKICSSSSGSIFEREFGSKGALAA
ncbi:hypothetical protein D3C87_1572870 [compost metagenome]